ncbi:hypothetical protein ACFFQF_14900 [Haladaptatus pallidirubidus]|uniref:hypothetical protein n=1 Tax=Haladaptatus pallidirubidus TaxID=1008152 RepID=UPI0035EC1258
MPLLSDEVRRRGNGTPIFASTPHLQLFRFVAHGIIEELDRQKVTFRNRLTIRN